MPHCASLLQTAFAKSVHACVALTDEQAKAAALPTRAKAHIQGERKRFIDQTSE